MTLVRGYNLESLWLCLLQNKVEELNQRLRQAIDGQCFMMPSVFHKVYQNLQGDKTHNNYVTMISLETKKKSCGIWPYLIQPKRSSHV